MKAHVKTKDNRITFEVEGATQKELFKQIAAIEEVFDAEQECGCCKSRTIRLQTRSVEDNEFYEMLCESCGAKFQFGRSKKGDRLFPKRREEGKPMPNRGWAKWDGVRNGALKPA